MRLLMEDDLRQRAIELLKLLKREEQFAQLKASIQMQTQRISSSGMIRNAIIT